MNRRAMLYCGVLAIACTFSDRVTAQLGRGNLSPEERVELSHNLDLIPLPSGDNESELLARMQRRKLAGAMKGNSGLNLADALKGSPQLKEYLEKNPGFADALRNYLKQQGIDGNNLQNSDYSKLSQLKNSLEKSLGKGDASGLPKLLGNLPKIDAPKSPTNNPFYQQGMRTTGPPVPRGRLGGPADGGSANMNPILEDRAASESRSQTASPSESPFGRQLGKWFEQMQKLDPTLRDSKAWQNTLEALSKNVQLEDGRWKILADQARTAREQIGDWTGRAQLHRYLPKSNLSWPQALTPSKGINLQFGGAKAPRFSPGMPSSSGGDSSALLWMFGLLLFAGMAMWLWRSRAPAKLARMARRSLGPWPVQPGAVRSREELIKAFEHLALLVCGPLAKMWNHRHIANQIAVLHTRQRPAVSSLATAYEMARYQPMTEPLPESVLAAARQDLVSLAKVARS